MKVRITRQTFVRGEAAGVGDVLDLCDAEASALISMRKAEPVKQAASIETAEMPSQERADLPVKSAGKSRRK